MPQRVAVLGASPKRDRYSNQAIRLLGDYGHEVIPVNPREQEIEGLPVVPDISQIEGRIDSLTVYLNPQISSKMAQDIVTLNPGRVILNPGAESPDLEKALNENGIEFLHACTLVMLRTDQFDN
ncbi:MAG: CoA-binding protein [Deferribacteres bacterium]|nr:CoA-binding protein [candidate division KSB1 bacterium]MCB9504440.1 CoA-binding protein [Deferribacteres bacterium]